MSKRIKPADNQTVNVILDFADRTVKKCVIEGRLHDTDWDKMYTYYKKIYPNLIEQLERECGTTAKVDK